MPPIRSGLNTGAKCWNALRWTEELEKRAREMRKRNAGNLRKRAGIFKGWETRRKNAA